MKALRILLISLFVVGALAYLNIIIPRPQQTQAKTYQEEHKWLAQEFTCASGTTNVIKLGDEETPDCKDGSLSNVSNYKGGVNISLENTSNWYRIHTSWGSYYCPELNGPCLDNKQLTQNTYVVKPGDYIHAYSDANKAAQNSCGSVQDDLAFTADVSYDNGKTWHNDACAFGANFNDPGQKNGNATATWCSTNVKCSSITPPPPPQYHNICQNFACKRVVGPGDNQCNTVTDGISSECSHLTCLNNTCERAPGPGQSNCTTEGASCGRQIQHLACQNNACILVPGAGQPQCTTEPDSCKPYHNVCQNQACVRIEGVGNDSCRLDSSDCQTPHLIVIKIVNNNHGGTKTASDFMLHVSNGSGDVADSPAAGSSTGKTYTLPAGNYSVSEDDPSSLGYHKVSISGDCDAAGDVTLVNGTTKTCVIENEDNGGGSCQMPSCNTNISGCSYPYPDTTSCSCGPLVCITQTPSQPNITINVSQQQQQQQQQEVLGASVAPAVTSNQLPRTGSGTEILLTLLGLLPIGLKLRKFV